MAVTNPQSEQFSSIFSQLLEKQRQEEDQLLQVFNHHLIEGLNESRSCNTFALFANLNNVFEAIEQKDFALACANVKMQELHKDLQKKKETRDSWQNIAMEKMQMVAELQSALAKVAPTTPSSFSSTLPRPEKVEAGASTSTSTRHFLPCKLCRYIRASIVFLPCHHLCVCHLCNFSVSACPICHAAKEDSIDFLLGND